MSFDTALYLLPGLVIGLTVHEAAHAISAKWLGDRTAEKMGRISLNPMRHLSLYGTLALFFLGFGWGKPVIVNLYNFKKPKFYYLLSSLAGPVSNLLICGICLGIMYMHLPKKVDMFFRMTFFINCMLAAINMIPIPPLDGSKIWPCLIPGMKPTMSGKWSMVWVGVLLIAMYSGIIGKLLNPFNSFIWSLTPEVVKNNQPRPDDFPEAFIEPEYSMMVWYNSFPRGSEDPNCYGMGFNVNNGKLEQDIINLAGIKLSDNGWQRLQYKIREPQQQAENKWAVYDKTKDFKAEKLTEYWGNDNNEVFKASYYREDDQDDLIRCRHYLYENNTNIAKHLKEYKKLHPKEFEGFDIVQTVAEPAKKQ